jgi:phosphopentomutase
MGLGRIEGTGLEADPSAAGVFGRAMEKSPGKDTTTGHWEMMGLTLPKPFPTYPGGFPQDVIGPFEKAIGVGTIGNIASSGTAILDLLGEAHLKTGKPIVYTSADSVFQIACHEDVFSPESLYDICRIARAQLTGEHAVGRVIARPFTGMPGSFTRTSRRRDFSLEPIGMTLLDDIVSHGLDSLAVGKIEDIFCMRGISHSNHAAGNSACIDAAVSLLNKDFTGLLFVNLVDFDMLCGHRNDTEGFSSALEAFDARLPEVMACMDDQDLLIITADHGCDPTYPGTDHTREYVPILAWHRRMRACRPIGTRNSFADIAATVSEALGLGNRYQAQSFYSLIAL